MCIIGLWNCDFIFIKRWECYINIYFISKEKIFILERDLEEIISLKVVSCEFWVDFILHSSFSSKLVLLLKVLIFQVFCFNPIFIHILCLYSNLNLNLRLWKLKKRIEILLFTFVKSKEVENQNQDIITK